LKTGATVVWLRLRFTIAAAAATMLVDDFPHDPNRPPTSSHSIVGRSLTRIIPPHGGYQDRLSCQRSVIVYDATVAFCRDFSTFYV